jgi:hypothetical protein
MHGGGRGLSGQSLGQFSVRRQNGNAMFRPVAARCMRFRILNALCQAILVLIAAQLFYAEYREV